MQQERHNGPEQYRHILPYFFKRYLPFLLVTLALFAGYVSVDITHERRQIEAAESARVTLAQRTIETDIAGVVAELRYLVDSCSVRNYCLGRDEAKRLALEDELITFARHIGRYQQLRWIDLQGYEQVRINYQDGMAMAVPRSQLQDKSQRYYFGEAMVLPPGGVYISPIDLNVEHGKVEEPPRPMLRFATATVDARGERNGLLILNYEAAGLLEHFARLGEGVTATLQLLNSDGFWLSHPDAERRFAFMYGRDERFGGLYPQEWQTIVERGHGQLHTPAGYFTFATLSMGEYARRHSAGEGAGGVWRHTSALPRDALLVVSHYAGSDEARLLRGHQSLYLSALLLLLVISVVGVWRLARSRWEQDVLMDRLELHARVMEVATNGVVITDAEQHIVSANRGFSELTGFSAEEVVGQRPTVLASGRHDKEFYRAMWREINTTGRWEGEIWNRHKSGEIFPEWLSISAIRDHHGKICNYIGLFSILSSQKSTESRLRELANSDPLTGLLNRNLLYDRAAQALSQCRRNQCRAAFLFIDLDGFKPINDQLGHAAGDMVLRQVAGRLKQCVRESDTVARFGGDEFVLLLQSISSREAVAELAQKVLDTIASDIVVAGEPCQVGASIGISLYPEDGESIETLLNAADQAMYRAKEAGRHRYLFASNA
jgi:diguanylate cyclase (GGDEF)-like protein/PAS domain S-box-containing protein